MGREMRRVASDEGAARIRKQGQPYQVLGSTDGHGTIDIVSFYHSCLFFFSKLIYICRHQHKNTVQALAWSPNGNFVASASRDQTVRVFDIRAMKELRVLKGHKKEVCCQWHNYMSILHQFSYFFCHRL